MRPIIRNAFIYFILVAQPLLVFCVSASTMLLYIAIINFAVISVLLGLDTWLQPAGSPQHDSLVQWGKAYAYFNRNFFFVFLLFLTVVAGIEAIFVQEIGYYALITIALLFLHKLIALPAIRSKQISFLGVPFFTKDIVLVYSIAVFFWSFALLPFDIFSYQLFVAVLISFIVYMFSLTKSQAIKHYRINKLFAFKIYILLLAVSCGRAVYMISAGSLQRTNTNELRSTIKTSAVTQWNKMQESSSTNNENIQAEQNQDREQQTGSVIATGLSMTDVAEGTGLISTGSIDTGSTVEVGSSPFAVDQTLSYADILQYLLATYNVPLVETQNIAFSNISYANTLYPVRRTAYERRLIGTTTSPTTLIRCDTYMVMKGILAGRNVDDQTGTIFDQYRAAAENNDALNNCQRGELLQGGNI